MQPIQMKSSRMLILFALLGANITIGYDLQCRFKVASYTYDLCPLRRQMRVSQENPTPPTVTRQDYYFDLSGEGLSRDGTLPLSEQCPLGTWICFQISNTRPNHPSEPRRILQIVPVAGNIAPSDDKLRDNLVTPMSINATAGLGSETVGGFPSLEIKLHGGLYLSHLQHALFTFLCDKSVKEPSLPNPDVFRNDSDHFSAYFLPKSGAHSFTWRTKHACPTAQEDPQDGEKVEIPLSDKTLFLNKKARGVVFGCLAIISLISYCVYVLRRKRQHPSLLSRFPFALPSLPFALPGFLSMNKRGSVRSGYETLTVDEYEIRSEESESGDGDAAVVDFQRQGLLNGSDIRRKYGSVK